MKDSSKVISVIEKMRSENQRKSEIDKSSKFVVSYFIVSDFVFGSVELLNCACITPIK